jgi:hypothetical protein
MNAVIYFFLQQLSPRYTVSSHTYTLLPNTHKVTYKAKTTHKQHKERSGNSITDFVIPDKRKKGEREKNS